MLKASTRRPDELRAELLGDQKKESHRQLLKDPFTTNALLNARGNNNNIVLLI